MIHLGDITKLHGDDIPIVDVVTGGSPCQDLSLAGKREGLSGSRSGLFIEQVRIIKEMREKDEESGRAVEFIRPRYMVWENVFGVFSSNGGKDFQTVLTEIVRIIEPNAPDVPMPKRWTKSGCLYDDMGKWSVAWRLHDAQFWGVPQRRKRIALVADFGGLSAPEILFNRKGMQWNTGESKKKRENTSETIGRCSDIAISFQERTGKEGGGKGILIQQDRTGALSTLNNQVVYSVGHDLRNARISPDGITDPLTATDYKDPIKVVYKKNYIRRLTPLECERLQGFPDGWTDIGEWIDSNGKKHNTTDTARYKALGNSIALPFWQYLARRICAQYERTITVGSLFDGIGGFPLVFQRCGAVPVWASEIEEFCIAVTNKHFNNNNNLDINGVEK